eukprot:CAMPEP_0176332424 /NCGR_PEP_ID=MMETSP0121_2-20121125/77065_1 /TAXON_ID=160619 /ORGANISM="Kryptoperidinium foliaceum, Strain CCMP 1326" /LENGTH=158 /DNA_ID=CAMNT_0017675313 /DNA_START=15 /DNA_END=491 /DNA_ORIENTATION=-
MFAKAVKQATRSVVKVSDFSVASRKFATYKSSTGLVGLAVDPNGRETLQALSAEVLASVKKIPEDAHYRTMVEQWFTYISKVVNENEDIRKIEDEIDLGQIEEVILMAKDELKLIDYYYEEKGWERVARAKREADKMALEMADVIEFSNPATKRVPPS